MPYYVHPKTLVGNTAYIAQTLQETTDFSGDIREYETAQDANDNCNRETSKVTFVPSEHEAEEWRQREQDRFNSGEYLDTPWQRKNLGVGRQQKDPTLFVSHYAHLSLKHPGLIAYTKSEEHGVLDRQTSVKPGRYLEEFYKDEFSAEEKAEYIASCSAEAMALQIATSADDIETVYRNGPRSCMSHDTSDYQSECHPTAVYGDSDLAIAYYGSIHAVSARAIVWPEKKRYGRLYGGEQVLRRLLEANGYTSGSMRGAYVRAIEHGNGGFVMPYVDAISSASYVGKITGRKGYWIKLDNEGSISCCETNGVSEGREQATCERCNNHYDPEDDRASGEYCPECSESQASCVECEEYFFTEDGGETLASGRGYLCSDCARRATVECAMCDTEWIEGVAFTSRECRERIAAHTTALCADCAEEYRYCDHCENFSERHTDDSRCDQCAHAFRCEHTADLIDVINATQRDEVSAFLGLPRSMPRDIADYETGSYQNDPLQEAIRRGAFHVSNDPVTRQCLIHSCHASIYCGDVYFRTPRGYGYCHSCAVDYSAVWPVAPMVNALTRIIDESLPVESESVSHAS